MKWNENLRAIRLRKNLTLRQVADRIGMTEGGVSHWETGQRVPNTRMLEKIAAALECEVAELVGSDPDFATTDAERSALDLLRRIPEDQRALALRLLSQLASQPRVD